MIDHIDFLRKSAAVLTDLAQRAPEIAEALRRLADDVEARATDLERSMDDSGDPQQP